MNILITSGTGKVGQEVTKILSSRGITPKIMTRDFERPQTWDSILKGIDKVCLITPPIQQEEKYAVEFTEKAFQMGVKHIVFLGIHNVMSAPHIPHFKAKIRVEEALKNSGKPYTIVECNNFFQNDIYFLPMAKERGLYLQPLGEIGLNRVDVRDIAEAMVSALFDEKHYYKSYPLVGAEPLTGEKIARTMSEVLNQDIWYPSDCMSLWEEAFTPMIPKWLLEDWKIMYQHFIANGLRASAGDLIQQEKILGRAPRKYENYLKEIV